MQRHAHAINQSTAARKIQECANNVKRRNAIINNTEVTNATLLTDLGLAKPGGVSESQVSDVINVTRTTPNDFLRDVRRWMDYVGAFFPFCDPGFDEVNCTNRHYCKSGGLVSIDKSRVCDGKTDCDDGSDEADVLCKSKLFYCMNKTPFAVDRDRVEDGIKDCSDGSDECPKNSSKSTIFSSQVDMIGNPFLRGAFWVMGFFALVGNFVVIVSNILKLKTFSKNAATVNSNGWLILNLATSDLLMGVYLLSIGIKGVLFSGTYCYHDIEWRSSQSCSLLGATALLSSETSIFIMTIMTTQRLFVVYKPIAMRNVRFRFTFVPTVVAWALGLLVALIPLLRNASGYFTIAVWYPNKFYKTNEVSRLNMIELATRMTNTSPASWEHTKDIVNQKVSLFKIHSDVHYYGFTSVCMPKLFLPIGEETWEYSMAIITINFVLFLYMLVGYIVIYKKSTKMAPPSAADARKQSMQNRIFRLIVTDFLCWIPICIMVYISLSGVNIDPVVYAISAGILLPLNSALNPLLYSQVISSRVYSLYTYVVQRWQTSHTPPNPPEIQMDQLNSIQFTSVLN
ncbi:G-protein coupled receptor GRL101-like [Ciona intestinalis]